MCVGRLLCPVLRVAVHLFLWGTDLRYLLLAVRYLPAGLALSWCYDWGSSLWSAVLLHMAINGLTLLRVTAG